MALQYYRTVIINDRSESGSNVAIAEPVYIRELSGVLARIYSDPLGQNEIIQDGSRNITNNRGEFSFYCEHGKYGQQSNGTTIPIEIYGIDGSKDDIAKHNSDSNAHPELSAFITSEADRAEVAADAATVSGNVYGDVASGISATVDGDYFSVVSQNSDNYLDLYLNDNNVASYQKTYPSAEYLTNSVSVENTMRLNILSNDNQLTSGKSLLYTDSGTPKAQSTTYAGYATALTISDIGDFDTASMHIQLDSPTPCRAYVLDTSLNVITSVDIDAVDGWNDFTFLREIKSSEVGNVAYIAIETVNRDPMTITTFTPPSEYASTTTYPAKATLIANNLGVFSNIVSSQYRTPMRIWNSRDLYIDYTNTTRFLSSRLDPIIASSLTTSMADVKGGTLENSVTNFTGTVVGIATAYNTPVKPFDAFRIYFNSEDDSSFRIYLKDDQLNTIESYETDTLNAGKNTAVIALSKKYGNTDLGGQFYVAIESIGHVSRVSTQNFTDDESVLAPTVSYPVKSTVEVNPEDSGWSGGGSSISYRLYAELYDIKNVSDSLSKAVKNADLSKDSLAIPSQLYFVDGVDLPLYKNNMTSETDYNQRLFRFNGGVNPSGGGSVVKDRGRYLDLLVNPSQSLPVESLLANRTRLTLDERTFNVDKVASTAGDGKSVTALCIGDSITFRGFWTQDLLELQAADGLDVSLIGTVGTAPNIYEGYGGKTVDWFFTNESSPFVYSGVFNFNQYMTKNSFTDLDYVFIHLGVNDVSPALDVDGAVTISESAMLQLEQMVTQFKIFNPSVKVGLMLPITSSFSESSWQTYLYGTTSPWEYNAKRSAWCNVMLSSFDNRTAERIYVLPTNLTIDNTTSYTEGDPIHPTNNGVGYESMAKTVFSFIKNIEL